jgi:peptide/nickel transport system permease protein
MARYVLRRLCYAIPLYLGILLFLMLLLRRGPLDPALAYAGEDVTADELADVRRELGLDRPFLAQYAELVRSLVALDFSRASWSERGATVGDVLARALVPTLSITLPALVFTTLLALAVALACVAHRGRRLDRALMALAALALSVSSVVYVVVGRHYGAYAWDVFDVFAIHGFEPGLAGWVRHCLLPVLVVSAVAAGYEARYYRAALVAESEKEHVRAAVAKGASPRRVLFGHVLRNALVPITARLGVLLPFVITGSLVAEHFFDVPGMGQALLEAVNARDFPVVETFTAVFAALFLAAHVLFDVVYALVDPRVRLA